MSKWDLASEIFTDYEGTITEATFRFNEYGGQMSFTFDEIDGREQPTFENYNLPPGWESNDGGETIERVAGDSKGIVKTSQWGKFIQSVLGLGDDVREALGEDAPTDSRAWIGTRWHMEVTEMGKGKPYKFTNDQGEKVEGVGKDKNYPTEYLGKDSQVSPAPSPSNGSGTVDSLSVLTDLSDPVLQSNINDWAKSLPYNDWFKQSYEAIQAAGIPANQLSDLITAMSRPEGLYAQLGGKG